MNPGASPGSDWRYVMGRNWDPYQNINFDTKHVEWPMGPLTFEDYMVAPTPKWVEAWVVQTSTGASQRTAQWTTWAPGRWTADGIPPGWRNGTFQTGMPASGIALLATHNAQTNTFEFEWWVDAVVLY